MNPFTRPTRSDAEIAIDVVIPLTKNYDAEAKQVLDIVNKSLDGREARVEKREADIARKEEVLTRAMNYAAAALTDAGNAATATAFKTEMENLAPFVVRWVS